MDKVTANYECRFDVFDGEALAFGYDFVPKGNFTFTFNQAVDNALYVPFCTPYLFEAKELVRRTQYLAIPIYGTHRTNISGEIVGHSLTSIYENKSQILFADNLPISDNVFAFAKTTPYLRVYPMIAFVGTFYPLQTKDSFVSALQIFDIYIWLFMVLSLCLKSLVYSLRIRRTLFYQSVVLDNYWDNMWRGYHSAFLGMRTRIWTQNSVLLMHSINIVMSFLLMTAFSSSILSTIINRYYTVIDSIDDLKARPELIPMAHYSQESLTMIKMSGTDVEKEMLKKAVGNTDPKELSDEVALLANHNELYQWIVRRKSRVMMANYGHALMVRRLLGLKETRLSAAQYFSTMEGYIINKNLDEVIAKTYRDILYAMIETGVYDKVIVTLLGKAAEIYKSEGADEHHNDHGDQPRQFKVKWKSALGPTIIGAIISIISFILEFIQF